LTRNVAAGIASAAVSTLVGIVVVPLYLRYVGLEAYGVIGFFVTLQGILQVADLGLAPTANRELARFRATGELPRARNLLHTLATLYWWVAAAIAAVLVATSPFIARRWLHAQHLDQDTLVAAVALMGVVIGGRWPIALYQGALMGSERLVVSSALSIGMALLGSVGAVLVLAVVSASVKAFFVWQGIVGITFALLSRALAWRALGSAAERARFDTTELRRVWRFSTAMAAIAVFSILFMQLDKVVLSKLLALDDFGRYMLATAVASVLYALVGPVFNAVYPRLCALVVAGNAVEIKGLYRQMTRVIGAIVFPAAMLLAVGGADVVGLWTRNPDLGARVGPIIALLASGSALHGVMHAPYALQLAHGRTRLPLFINAVLLVVLVPLLLTLAPAWGALGGAASWLILQILYLGLGSWITHRQLLKGLSLTWLVRDVGGPLAISVAAGLVAMAALRGSDWPALARAALVVLLAAAASAGAVLSSRELRTSAFRILRAGLHPSVGGR
jgi:O-antigen/teichoic acid export membrane protein